jgi:glycosyltransferase involved in cell wall biosynthesis
MAPPSSPSSSRSSAPLPRILIVAEHASASFGGEAALPLHYFRVLLARGAPVWLITHARVRSELAALFPQAMDRILFVEDSRLHRWMCHLGNQLPSRISYFTTGFISRFSTQLEQKRLARQLIVQRGIQVVHQPMPVSPREPSLMFDLGTPVVIGPMNGGMEYPPAFQPRKIRWVAKLVGLGRATAGLMNRLMPGKPRAAALLVANERTRQALPLGLGERAVVLPENGVDLSLWQRPAAYAAGPSSGVPTFVFMGRMVDWKAVDLLLYAFDQSSRKAPMSLTLIGDGPESPALREQARQQGRLALREGEAGKIFFAGWQPQATCADILRRSQALVLPSLWECGGAVVLEAMACGLPVIATAWGGPMDYLDDRCGILVPPTTRPSLIDGLAQAMRTLASDPDLRHRMGSAGRAKVQREFDWEHKVDVMLDVYRRLIAEHRTTA